MCLFGNPPPPPPPPHPPNSLLAGDPRVALLSTRIHRLPLFLPFLLPPSLHLPNLGLTQRDFLPRHIPQLIVLSIIILLRVTVFLPSRGRLCFTHHKFPQLLITLLNPPSSFSSILSVEVECVDGAAVRSGQKSRPGLRLLACLQ